MTEKEASLVERLCEAKNPRDLDDWESQDGYYVAACRVSAEDVPGLIDIVRKWSDPDWPVDPVVTESDQEDAELLPVTAWRTLADLKADAAVQPLIDMLCEASTTSAMTGYPRICRTFSEKSGNPPLVR